MFLFFLRRCCKSSEPPIIQLARACDSSDTKEIVRILERFEFQNEDLDEILVHLTERNNYLVISTVLDETKYFSLDLNRMLKLACEKNYPNLVEIYLAKGANPIVGLRVLRISQHITQLLQNKRLGITSTVDISQS